MAKRDPLAMLEERFARRQYSDALKVLRGKKTSPKEFGAAMARAKKARAKLNRRHAGKKKGGKR